MASQGPWVPSPMTGSGSFRAEGTTDAMALRLIRGHGEDLALLTLALLWCSHFGEHGHTGASWSLQAGPGVLCGCEGRPEFRGGGPRGRHSPPTICHRVRDLMPCKSWLKLLLRRLLGCDYWEHKTSTPEVAAAEPGPQGRCEFLIPLTHTFRVWQCPSSLLHTQDKSLSLGTRTGSRIRRSHRVITGCHTRGTLTSLFSGLQRLRARATPSHSAQCSQGLCLTSEV